MTAEANGVAAKCTPLVPGTAVAGYTPFDLPLERGGTTFIEASAGTGKTHALTTLVARLVLEEARPIDRILVVTFTRAATAELRSRIRRVLRVLFAAVRTRHTDGDATEPEADPQVRELLAGWERRVGEVDFALAARRLEAAMHDIDRANVFTIHGFCQRVLADLAFESGFPFGCEVTGNDGEMVAGAVRDFWRRQMYPASMPLIRHAVEHGFLPDGLADWVSMRRAKVGAELVGCAPPAEPMKALEATWRGAFEAVRMEWEQHRSTFRAQILEGDWLNRQRYQDRRTKRELAALEALFSASEPQLPGAGACGRYGRETLAQACRKGKALPDNPLFDALDRLEEESGALRAAFDQWLRWTRREALVEVREAVRSRIRTDRRLAYDDLLIELDDALGGAGGARLAERIRREFPSALIDEYQDTDPVQARIFHRVYGEAGAGSPATTPNAGSTPLAPDDSERVNGPEAGGSPAGDKSAMTTRDEGTTPGPFIVVGDPKQSIYRFRGADVFAYLAARRTAHERLHLERNWRSVPALVDAVNAIFAQADPFVTAEIEYRPVAAAEAADGRSRPPPEVGGGPLDFWLLLRPEGGKPIAKQDANPVVAGATANEIARLLELGAGGDAAIEGRPLTGADIAVLVRTRKQGRAIAGELHARGVRSVEIDDGSVFHTREAEQLERLLWSLADAGRGPRVRGALAGDLFGLDADALLALGEDENAWSVWAGRLADWRAHWESRGIGSVLLQLLEGEGGAQHLLGYLDGPRRLTNYRHLAEILQACETRERLAPAELAAWLNCRRRESESRDDEEKLRIESDEELVRILTVHGSKGLEFPVVFCPFAWDAPGPKRRAGSVDTVYHRSAAEHYREVIDLDPDEPAEAMERLEEFAESVRLLYVALTRAKYRCVVAWGQVNGAEHSPLAWLLHRPAGGRTEGVEDGSTKEGTGDGSPDERARAAMSREHGTRANDGTNDPDATIAALAAVASRFKKLDPREWRAEIDAFARRVPNAVSVSELAPVPPPIRDMALAEDTPTAIAAREPSRAMRRIRSLTSFSALSAHGSSAGGTVDGLPADRPETDLDRPDHDQHEAPLDPAVDETGTAGANPDERTAFTFPRGPVAGSCLHRMFERLDDPLAMSPERPNLDEICRDALDDFGFERAWRRTARTMVERTRSVLLHESRPAIPGDTDGAGAHEATNPPVAAAAGGAGGAGAFRLADPHRRLVEMEFHFPVDGLDRERLGARMAEHGYRNPFADMSKSESSVSPPSMHGFLRGFIDLVVERAGRWYILDYKSNWLGPGPDDYMQQRLDTAMHAGGYTLQYLVYLVALHRYLTVRLPDYDYERHVGGAFYLFVRGIDPAAGMDRGVFFDRPPTECLVAIDDCFRGGGA